MNPNKLNSIFQYSLYVLMTLFILSCNSQPGTQQIKNESESASDKEKLELNNGNKWTINPEMKPHIHASSILLDEYISAGNQDFKRLADDLSAHTDLLISSCTMEGPDHDALHKWLHPHMELIKKLGKSGDLNEADEIISKLKESFNQFNQYFE